MTILILSDRPLSDFLYTDLIIIKCVSLVICKFSYRIIIDTAKCVINGSSVFTGISEHRIVKDDSVQYDYTIDRFGIKTQQGEELAEIPAESFIAEATITKNTDRENADYLVIASYDSEGSLIGINYSYASMVQGNQYSFGTLVKNDEGNIASIKAFVWDGLSTMEPLAISAYVK